ncbi:MAG: hypothetical protein U0R49_00225 [Fimbriimonadales bacterium]
MLLAPVLLLSAAHFAPADHEPPVQRSQNVVLVLIDGLRWQEVFSGADETMMNKENGGVEDVAGIRKAFWRDTGEQRRAALMPFLWSTGTKQGQIYGNKTLAAPAQVTNNFHFSYPGYSEMICGFADPAINSNAARPNKNVSVFEWLHSKPDFKGRVATFGAWETVNAIINKDRCGFPVFSGLDPVNVGFISGAQATLNKVKAETQWPWGTEPYDSVTFYSALEYLKANRPRAMWITFGETDEFAHEGRYDHYLNAAHNTDKWLGELWSTLQSYDQYRGRTTMIVAVDHGRGNAPKDWMNHGVTHPGSNDIWVAIIGPDVSPRGEMRDVTLVTQSQIAATVASAVGEDFCAENPKAAKPIRFSIKSKQPALR